MHTWEITGINLPPIIVEAESFDDALKQARRIEDNYCGGRVIERITRSPSLE